MSFSQILASRQRTWMAATFFALLLVFGLFSHSRKTTTSAEQARSEVQSQKHKTHQATDTKGHVQTSSSFLHLLIPSLKSDLDLCQTVMSAAAAGYPTPILPTWGDDPVHSDGFLQTRRIHSTLQWLTSLHRGVRDDDLVIITDQKGVWFQLRPETLIERYYSIVDRANDRARQQYGHAAEKEGLRQSIVFAAKKTCAPWDEDDVACYAVPDSILPEDLYSQQSSSAMAMWNETNAATPRWLDAGFIMGPVTDVRRLYNQLAKKLKYDDTLGLNQKVFSLVFGEQEYRREALRIKHQSWFEKWHHPKNASSVDDTRTKKPYVPERMAATEDFGITLDYEGLLGHNIKYAEHDSAWITYNSSHPELQGIDALKLPKQHPISASRVQTELPLEVENSKAPFWHSGYHPDLKTQGSWDSVPLYTDLYSGHVPAAVIHPKLARFDASGVIQRRKQWQQMWFYTQARAILQSFTLQPSQPLAVTRDTRPAYKVRGTTAASDDEEVQHIRRWWPTTDVKGGAWGNGHIWLKWGDLCPRMEYDIFGDDGKGIWRDLLQDASFALHSIPRGKAVTEL